MSNASTMRATSVGSYGQLSPVRESSTDALLSSPLSYRHFGPSAITTSAKAAPGPRYQGAEYASPYGVTSKPKAKTPFFNPSKLESIMEPLKQEYIKNQTNEVLQAKAAYEQLNDQLTNELPQLIDLRLAAVAEGCSRKDLTLAS
jgi:hypothetical protein